MTREKFLTILPELTAGYQPSGDVINRIANINLLMIIGPSGVGKTTLMKKLSMPFVPSDTTRPQRPGEVDGVDYYFHKDYAALAQDINKGYFLQVVIGAGGDFYATRGTSYPAAGWASMAVVADVIPIFRKLGFRKTLSVFIVPPSYEEWQHRLKDHNLSMHQLSNRLEEAKRSFAFGLNDPEVTFILNDEIDDAVKQLKKLVQGLPDPDREGKARQNISNILGVLKSNEAL